MQVSIRKYKDEDIKDMVRIWNEVIEEVLLFHRKNFSMKIQEKYFSILRHTVLWQKIQMAISSGCIFCIRIMLAGVVIYAMQATLSAQKREDYI